MNPKLIKRTKGSPQEPCSWQRLQGQQTNPQCPIHSRLETHQSSMKESELKRVPSISLCQVHTTIHSPVWEKKKTQLNTSHLTYPNFHFNGNRASLEVTIEYLALPMETTYLRGLTLALVWPRNGVGLREVLELSMDDILIILQVTTNFSVEREMKVYMW